LMTKFTSDDRPGIIAKLQRAKVAKLTSHP
jgi:hypothetical protein